MSRMISIITPAEKNEKYLNKALESLYNQTYKDFEVLLLHSDIKSLKAYIDEVYLKDERYRFIETSADLNVGAVRNIGIRESSGDYIYFLDSDDYIPEKTLHVLIENIKNQPIVRGRMESADFSSSNIAILPGINKSKTYTDNRFDLIKNDSALNFLISKSVIERLNLKFSEDVKTYSDLTFIVPLLEEIAVIPLIDEAIYFRRRRNDPINNPSLRQLPVEQRAGDLFKVYNRLKNSELSPEAERYLDDKLLNFYRKTLVDEFRDDSTISQYFDDLAESIRKISPKTISQKDRPLKKEVKAIQTNRISVFRRINNLHHSLRNIRDAIKSIGTSKGRRESVYTALFTKMGLKDNLVVFESFQGKSYADSPKYIYQHMLKNRKDYKFVWVLNEQNDVPGKPKTVKRFSLKYYYYTARAKYIVSNVRMPNSFIKRADQVYLQTWHGTPLKRLAGDMEDVYMPGTNAARYKMNFNRETDKWDYLIAPNQYSSDIFRRAFWFDNTMLETGYPRNDVLVNSNDPDIIKSLKIQLRLPPKKKIILYAPTWRDDEYYKVGQYQFSLKLDLHRMKEQFGDDHIILLRMHYVVASNLDLDGLEGFAYDVSSYNDVSELYLVSDILITDYSSVFFDYANLKRPILFYTYDIEKYKGQLRGFYIDMETELPGPLLTTNDEVFDAIENIDEVSRKYSERYDEFHERFCSWDDGRASEKVVDAVFKD